MPASHSLARRCSPRHAADARRPPKHCGLVFPGQNANSFPNFGSHAGACSIIKPELVAEKVLGVASSGSNAVMIRGAGLAAALLGARLGRDSDSQAASSAALWLGGWAYMLRNAAGVAGRTQTICALLALSAVRRSGGRSRRANQRRRGAPPHC